MSSIDCLHSSHRWLLAFSMFCATESVVIGESIVAVTSQADMTLKFNFEPDTGIYKISLRNEGKESGMFLDWFFDKSRYEKIPGSIRMSIRINGEMITEAVGDNGRNRSFSPRAYTNGTYVLEEEIVANICGLCAIERSYDIRDLMNDMFGYISTLSNRRQDPDFSLDIRKLEIKLSMWTTVVRDGRFLLRVESDWMMLGPQYSVHQG